MDETSKNKKIHSVPVPRYYKNCAKILTKFMNKESSLKSLIYKEKQADFKRLLATLTKVASELKELESVLKEVKLFENEPKFDKALALILTSELLKKGKLIDGSCTPVKVINGYFNQIKEIYENRTVTKACKSSDFRFPKYARINTLKVNPNQLHKLLSNKGLQRIKYKVNISYVKYLELVKKLEPNTYLEDMHIANLLVFPPEQEFWSMEIIEKCLIILQDKASCFPPALCDLKPYSCVIDACAAPGNKTSQLAAMISKNGRVLAFDRDQTRYARLETFMKLRGAKCVKTVREDFTSTEPADYKEYQTIIVDPSCSNSGVNVKEEDLSSERLQKLSFFQKKILCHALSFKTANTVVYSTCSSSEEENEQVVEEALKLYGNEFRLENLQNKFNGWKHYGDSKYPFQYQCLRTSPEEDLCHGFFVAKFVRCETSHDDLLASKRPMEIVSPDQKSKKRKAN